MTLTTDDANASASGDIQLLEEAATIADLLEIVVLFNRSFTEEATASEVMAPSFTKVLADATAGTSDSFIFSLDKSLYDAATMLDAYDFSFTKDQNFCVHADDVLQELLDTYFIMVECPVTTADDFVWDMTKVISDSASADDDLVWIFEKTLDDAASASEDFVWDMTKALDDAATVTELLETFYTPTFRTFNQNSFNTITFN